MKKLIPISLLLLFISLLVSCKSINTNENNNIEITEKTEKIIEEYLDNNTDDIDLGKNSQKCYTAFEILGTSDNKIYLWLQKEGISAISLPVVLTVKNNDDELIITSHDFPGDGASYSKYIKKLFPNDIFPEPEEHNAMVERLNKIIQDKKSLEQKES